RRAANSGHTNELSPSQQEAFEGLKRGLQVGSILYLWGGTGRGKTTVLTALQKETAALYLDLRDFAAEQEGKHPLELEESFARLVRKKIGQHKVVLFDDVHLLDLGQACHFYPRSHYLTAVMMAVATDIV